MKKIARLVLKILNVDWRYYFFKKTGYSVYTEETSGKTVEFIGTSGVGKTTLYRECVNKLRNRWFFAYQLDFVKRKIPSNETIQKTRIERCENCIQTTIIQR